VCGGGTQAVNDDDDLDLGVGDTFAEDLEAVLDEAFGGEEVAMGEAPEDIRKDLEEAAESERSERDEGDDKGDEGDIAATPPTPKEMAPAPAALSTAGLPSEWWRDVPLPLPQRSSLRELALPSSPAATAADPQFVEDMTGVFSVKAVRGPNGFAQRQFIRLGRLALLGVSLKATCAVHGSSCSWILSSANMPWDEVIRRLHLWLVQGSRCTQEEHRALRSSRPVIG